MTKKTGITAGIIIVALLVVGYFAWNLFVSEEDALALAMEKAKEITSYRMEMKISDFRFDPQELREEPLAELFRDAAITVESHTSEMWIDVVRNAGKMIMDITIIMEHPLTELPMEMRQTSQTIWLEDDFYSRTSYEIPLLGISFSVPKPPNWLRMDISDLAELLEDFDPQKLEHFSLTPMDYLLIFRGEREELKLLAGPIKKNDLTYYRLAITPKYHETMMMYVENFIPQKDRQMVKSMLPPVGSEVEVWINEQTSFVENLVFDLPIGTITAIFSDINAPVQIDRPTDFIWLKELLEKEEVGY